MGKVIIIPQRVNRVDKVSGSASQQSTDLRVETPASRNILVLGNGFDLCLEKRTSFGDFLTCFYIVCLLSIYDDLILNVKRTLKKPSDLSIEQTGSNFKFLSELFEKFDYQKLTGEVSEVFRGEQQSQCYSSLAVLTELASECFAILMKNHQQADNPIAVIEEELKLTDNLFLQDLVEMLFMHCGVVTQTREILTLSPAYKFTLLHKYKSGLADNYSRKTIEVLLLNSSLTPKILVKEFVEELKKFTKIIQTATIGEPDSDDVIRKQGFLAGWLDVERFIEAEVTQNEVLLRQFFLTGANRESQIHLYPDLNKEFSADLIQKTEFAAKAYQAGIKDFNRLFADFLQLQEPAAGDREKYIASKKDILKKEEGLYLEDAKSRSRQVVNEINLSEANYDYVIDFNYTQSSDLIFNPEHKDGVIFHVHGRASENNLVLGYSRDPQKYQVEKFCYPFEKKFLRVINNTEIPPYAELTAQPFKLTIFGHSCSEADSYILKQLLTNANLIRALVLCYSEDALISACNNLTAIVGEETMDELLSVSDGQRRLYFAIREDKEKNTEPG